MQSVFRKMGNSTAIIVPKALLAQMGAAVGTPVAMRMEGNDLVLSSVRKVREGWAEAAAALADEDDPELEDWLAFGNEDDDDWTW